MNSVQHFRYILLLLATVNLVRNHAFEVGRQKLSSKPLRAWTIPTDMTSWDAGNLLNSQQQLLSNLGITSSWYTVSNPNRAKRVYEDVPYKYDYTLITAGNDWPTTTKCDSDLMNSNVLNRPERPSNKGPIRKAVRWIRGLRN